MSWDQSLTNLQEVLANLYPWQQDIGRIVDAAGLPRTFIRMEESPLNAWHNVLVEALKRGTVRAVVEAARQDYPDNEHLRLASIGQLLYVSGPSIGEDIEWRASDPNRQLERIFGSQSSLVPVSFLEVGFERQRSVARIRLSNGYGSGFLTRDNLLITNNHVIPTIEVGRAAIAEFNVQTTVDGLDTVAEEFQCSPEAGFATSIAEDWTAIRLDGEPNSRWGCIDIADTPIRVSDRVNVIQHPGGGKKQMSFFHNVVAFVDDTVVQSLTDTMHGSSGSPVFDRDWHLVALHHAGGPMLRSDPQMRTFPNEGIRIKVILDGIKAL